MKPPSVRIDYDETGSGQFRVAVSYHEGDTADRLGQAADVVVYVPTEGPLLAPVSPRDF
jgi:hypothetical protein